MVGELPAVEVKKAAECSRANCDNAAVIFVEVRGEEKAYCATHAPKSS